VPPKHFDVFLSYNSRDRKIVSHIGRKLSESGFRPWLDTWNLAPGDPWQDVIETTLETCSACAVFVGRSIGPWQHSEMRAAINRRISSGGPFRVIPVLLPNASRPKNRSVPPFLSANSWVEFSGPDDEEALHRLICGVRGIEPGDAVCRIRPQIERRTSFEIALDGTFTVSNRKRVLRALRSLQDLLDDQTLTVKKVRRGSIVVELEGTRYGYQWLQYLISAGHTFSVGGFGIKSVSELPIKKQSRAARPVKGGLGGRKSGSLRRDFDNLVDRLLAGNLLLQEAIEVLERALVQRALERSAGNQREAAKLLGVHRNTLQRKQLEYGLSSRTAPRAKPAARIRSPYSNIKLA